MVALVKRKLPDAFNLKLEESRIDEGARPGGILERGAPMRNEVRARSANARI